MTLATRAMKCVDNGNGSYTYNNVVALDGDDDSTPFILPRGTVAASFQAVGTFDSGTIAVQASNDGTTYAALPTAVSHTAAGAKSLALADLGFRYYKFIVTGGGGSSSLTGYFNAYTRR